MTRAFYQCPNGHIFSQRVTEDSPDINCIQTEGSGCDECGAAEEDSDLIEYASDEEHE